MYTGKVKKYNKIAFTLIELLVVIVIVGILVVLVAFVVKSVRAKSFDVKRISDIKQIQTALEVYRLNHNIYPTAIISGLPIIGPNGEVYMKKVSSAPGQINGDCVSDVYNYQAPDPTLAYSLSYCLGGAVQNVAAGQCVAVPGNICTQVLERTVKALVVGGGGGGATMTGGGGGAGGLLYDDTHVVSAQSYDVVVGAMGAGQVGSANPGYGSDGANSSFDNLTAYGGGGGGSNSGNGRSGGSGGGSGHNNTTGGTGVAGQGYSARTSTVTTAPNYGASGGGGAGGMGSAATNFAGGSGGPGLAFSISGTLKYYAGGGGGGTYNGGTPGLGGSGVGGNSPMGNAVANTGSGGGGQINNQPNGGNGSAGIVIIRYRTADFGACTGGTISTDGADTIHTFVSTGIFTVVY